MKFKVKYLCEKKVFDSHIIINRLSDGKTSLEFRSQDETYKDEDAHLYSAFIRLREQLNLSKKILLCKGCCLKVFPSGSQLRWIYAYNLVLGMRINPKIDVVVIFDEETDLTKLASFKEQQLFYREWLNSISGLPY